MSGRLAKARINIRLPAATKIEIDRLAHESNMSPHDYIRRNWERLVQEGKVQVDEDTKISVINPFYPDQPPQHLRTPYGRGGYTPGYGYPAAGYPEPDPMDKVINQMGKMVSAKMMMDFMKGMTTPEQLLAARKNNGSGHGGDNLSLEQIMKYKMLSKDDDGKMNQLMMQMMLARSTGDKGGEDRATQMMIALMANQSNQQQATMQQYMANNQSNTQATSAMFGAALGAQTKTTDAQRQADKDSNSRYNELQAMMQSQNMNFMNQMFNQQIQFSQVEMQRIRDQKDKSPLDQLANLIEMRNTNPVYKAAFNAALGVNQESTIGKLIPQLKELGIDKLVEKVGGALTGMLIKPKMPTPAPAAATGLPAGIFPPPTSFETQPPQGPASNMGPPLPQPAGTPLENLKLPPETGTPPTKTETAAAATATEEFNPTPTPPPQTFTPKKTDKKETLPEYARGYTNLDAEEPKEK